MAQMLSGGDLGEEVPRECLENARMTVRDESVSR